MPSDIKPVRKLDRIDRQILHELQQDGRISYVNLARKVNLSTSPCLERVRRLEQDGFITGYTAILDPEKLNAGLTIFVELSLTYTSGEVFEEFKEAVASWPQIQECHMVSGGFDYLLKIRIEDISSYRQLLGEILHKLPGVRDSRSLIVVETLQESTNIQISPEPSIPNR
ncbi:unnamed protein product [Cyprideis torosa]|uniref:Uncharacterized protein n=1 Tax=Cyprideis torosa TaxID=163714 RepID=A0A7R8ZXY2_9CRUS|nr:unnamed protein product [Cyprideis torosa]CAG0910796.1 unnamed protein product [Cyprideis torosa]